jgi:hypothetical protein
MGNIHAGRAVAILFVIAASTSTCGLSQSVADPETHLIPAGFSGEVTIVFRSANGERIVDEGGARLYTIPQNGILITEGEPNGAVHRRSPLYFAVARDGTRFPIPRVWASTVANSAGNRAAKEIEIFYPRRGHTTPKGLTCDVQFDQYFVGTRSELLDRDDLADRRRLLDFLSRNFVCR